MDEKEDSGPMMKTTTAAAAALAASIAIAGCAPTTEQASTVTNAPPPTVWTGSPAPSHGGGHGRAGEAAEEAPAVGANLHKYIVDNKIAEVPIKADEPGTPNIEFPLPPDWSPAGDRTPDWAYGAIVYGKAADPQNPPYMYAIASKLTGDVDAAKILELAPGQLNELPGFKPVDGGPRRATFAGYDAVNYVGTYEWEGKSRSVGQETIVIPGKDALFVLQLNGEAPGGQEQVVIDAANVIRDKTTIALPS